MKTKRDSDKESGIALEDILDDTAKKAWDKWMKQ